MIIIGLSKSFFIVLNKFSMNVIPIFFTITSILIRSFSSSCQTTQLYIDYDGQIIDRVTYLKTKEEATQAYQKQNVKDELYEEVFDIKTRMTLPFPYLIGSLPSKWICLLKIQKRRKKYRQAIPLASY